MPTIRFRDLDITVEGDRCTIAPAAPVIPPPPPPPPPVVPPPAWSWPKPGPGIYVAPTGSASGTGTVTNPLTLAAVLAQTGGGQQVWIRGGRYDLAQTLNPRLVGTAAAPWKLSAYPGEEPLLNIATAGRHGLLFKAGAAFQEWKGIRFADLSGTARGVQNYDLVKFDGGDRVGFAHCQFDDCRSSGVLINGAAKGLWFYGCVLLNNGTNSQLDHGIYAKSKAGTLTVENCFILNNAGHQLHFYNGGTGTSEGVQGIRAMENFIFCFGEPSDRPIIFQDSGQPVRDCVASGNVYFNAFPGVNGTDRDRSALKLVNGEGNCRIEGNALWGGDIVATGSVTRDKNIVVAVGDWAKTESWVRPSRLDAGIAHVGIFNPEQRGAVDVDLTGKMPAGRYEIRSAAAPQKVLFVANYQGAGAVTFPMTGLAVAPQARTGGFAWKSSPKANGFVLRRVP